MLKIHKYPISQGEQEIMMPFNPKPLSVAMVQGVPCIYCLVDTTSPDKPVKVCVFPTGEEIPLSFGHFMGTFHFEAWLMPSVFHVFIG